MALADWQNPNPDFAELVDNYHETCVRVYKQDKNRIEEDAKKEASIAEGGYGRKQIQELVQNAADALKGNKGRIEVRLTSSALYVANQGKPFNESGIRALLYAHLSNKRDDEIGRFGLGFKSISGISNNPQIFSQSVSFVFDKDRTKEELLVETELEEHEVVPSLRLAWRVDATAEFSDDKNLKDLSRWATTIVKVPLKDGAYEGLAVELKEFDESFCLFASHVSELRLYNLESGENRELSTKRSGQIVTLKRSSGESLPWLVLSRKHIPSESAIKSVGQTAKRESIIVSWAVPLSGRPGIGQLYAFFPVKSEITLSGRLNAPWKLSEDRINLIPCDFNQEILEETVPLLVEEARARIIEETSVGRYIDILPARGRESRSWADNVINEPIIGKLRTIRSLPNANGELRSPNTLVLTPSWRADKFEPIPTEVMNLWHSNLIDGETWIHPECVSSTERRAKVVRIVGHEKSAPVKAFLEAIVDHSNHDATQSAAAIQLAAEVYEELRLEDRNAEVVLLSSGQWVPPLQGRCFFSSSENAEGQAFVHPLVAANHEIKLILEQVFGISDFSDSGQLATEFQTINTKFEIDWDNVWRTIRGNSFEKVKAAFEEILNTQSKERFKVKNARGEWVKNSGQFIPGAVFKNIEADADWLVDPKFHAADHQVLELLGIREKPVRTIDKKSLKWTNSFKKYHTDDVAKTLGVPYSRRRDIDFGIGLAMANLGCFEHLSDTNRAALSTFILSNVSTRPIHISWSGNREQYKTLRPELWLVQQFGLFETQFGLRPANQTFVFDDDLEGIEHLVPVLKGTMLDSKSAVHFGFKSSMQDLKPADYFALVRMHIKRDDEVSVGEVYAWQANFFPNSCPAKISLRDQGEWKSVDASEIAICVDDEIEDQMEKLGFPTLRIRTAEDADLLTANWGLRQAHEIPTVLEHTAAAEKEDLHFRFPPLEKKLGDEVFDLQIQLCSTLERRTAVAGRNNSSMDIEYGREGSIIYSTARDEFSLLEHCLKVLGLDHSPVTIDSLLEQSAKTKNSSARKRVRAARSDEERLLLAVGEERLNGLISQSSMEFIAETKGFKPSGLELSRLIIEMFGENSLAKACKLSGAPLPIGTPPSTWNGSHQAVQFVTDLNFSEAWAGKKKIIKSKPTDFVDGPSKINSLHDYQAQVSERIRSLLTDPDVAKRGIVSLPTGAGKTRVTVQSIIETIASGHLDADDAEFSGPILWVVNGEELCEQAIDSWAYLWRVYGRTDTRLILSRHWGNYKADERTEGVQVVVATYQKLISTLSNTELDWLRDCPIMVIDEAHSATAPSYTKILEWTGRSSRERTKPLIGLTATPFRGARDSEQTAALERRFDSNFLDAGVFGDDLPLVRLQRDGVLSKVSMQTLRSDDFVSLTENEIEMFKNQHWLPKYKEKELGQSVARTLRIVDSIKSAPDDWSIIVFATSVENADTLATILTLEGIPAMSINGSTDDAERKLATERFKSGELRVLTNYAVLSQGFDAPKTDAVYITRPTTSEVRYLQMIGRGLRGPKNGGTERVHIVNLLDNIQNFDLSIDYQAVAQIAEENWS